MTELEKQIEAHRSALNAARNDYDTADYIDNNERRKTVMELALERIEYHQEKITQLEKLLVKTRTPKAPDVGESVATTWGEWERKQQEMERGK